MNYEAALEAAQASQAKVRAPAFTGIEARMAWKPSAALRPEDSRRWLASSMAGLAALVFAVDAWISLELGSPVLLVLALPCMLLLASALAVHRPFFGAQLTARATWWTFLCFGTAWASTPAETLPVAGAFVAWGCGVALLSVGKEGLLHAQTRKVFDPVAFRGTLLAAMVLALTNAHLLALVGLTRAEAYGAGAAPLGLLAGGFASLATVVGLARLRGWAVLAGVLVNVAVLALAAVALTPPVAPVVLTAATIQLILHARLLRGFSRGSPVGAQRRDLPRIVPALAVVLLLALATVAALTETYADLLWN